VATSKRRDGVEAQADWNNLRTPETYLGHERGTGSPHRTALTNVF
jgi:hypothetical protein